jgi:lupus La protein
MATATEESKEETKIGETEDVKEPEKTSESAAAGAADSAPKTADDNGGKVAEEKEEDAASEETVAAVAERLQFFFGNANLRKDNFLRKRLADNNNQVDVETLLKFNSVKALTSSAATVVRAAKTLPAFLTVSDDSKNLGRGEPFGEAQMNEHIPLTLLLKNIPFEGQSYKLSVQEIRSFFEPFGEVALVKLGYSSSKHKGRKPKGSCMVEFATQEGADAAAAAVATSRGGADVDPAPEKKLMVGDQQVSIVTLKDQIEFGAKDDKANGAANHNGGDDEGDDDEEEAIEWKKGSVISITGVPANCDREAILDAVAKAVDCTADDLKGKVYVDYSRGQPTGAIRFDDPKENQVADMCQKLASGDAQVAGAKVESAKVLEGEEEEKYWKDFAEFKKRQRRNRQDSGRKPKRRRHN